MAKKLRLFLPLIVLALVGAFLLRGLWLDPRKLPSVFIDKPLPAFTLPVLGEMPQRQLFAEDRLVSKADLAGKPYLLNVFASWCAACVVEHPHFLELSRRNQIRLVGLAYKDGRQDTRNWLGRHGNPYDLILVDQDGRAGIDFGVYGVPETFVIDSQGIVVHKHVGPIDQGFFNTHIAPLLKREEGAGP